MSWEEKIPCGKNGNLISKIERKGELSVLWILGNSPNSRRSLTACESHRKPGDQGKIENSGLPVIPPWPLLLSRPSLGRLRRAACRRCPRRPSRFPIGTHSQRLPARRYRRRWECRCLTLLDASQRHDPTWLHARRRSVCRAAAEKAAQQTPP